MTTLSRTAASPVLPERERSYTAEDLLHFPQEWRYELVQGKLREMPPPAGDDHGALTYDLGFEIGAFVRANGLGRCWAAETGFVIARDPDTIRAADFAFVTQERLTFPFVTQERLTFPRGPKFVPIVPDLVLETRSPTDRGPSVATKVGEWLNAGVRVVLVLEPSRRTLTAHRPNVEPITLDPEDTLEGYDVLPGLAVPLQRIFKP